MERWGVVFFDNPGLIADTTEALTGGWSHCGFLHPDGLHVSDINLGEKFETKHFNAAYGTYEIVYLDLMKDQECLLKDYIQFIKQVDYDVPGALKNVFPAFKQNPSKLYCSEAVRNGLIYCKYRTGNISDSITPTKLYELLKG